MSIKHRLARLEARHGPPDYTHLSAEEIRARLREIWERASESGRREIIAMTKEQGYTVDGGLWRKTKPCATA
jgi:S-adenosylmethionine:diacylglycerol 3-amino-3-carboxypropyl transferase